MSVRAISCSRGPVRPGAKDGRQALETSWHNLATTALEPLAARAQARAAHSVYFGVAIQHPARQPSPFQRSRNDSAYILPGLYFDLDLASGAHAASTLPTTDTEALDFLAALPSRPSSSCIRAVACMPTGCLSTQCGSARMLIALP